MIQVWLVGPYKNKTMKVGNLQFIDGTAYVTRISPLMASYGVKEYPPEDWVDPKVAEYNEEIKDFVNEVEVETSDEIIKKALEARLNKKPEPITSLDGFGAWFKIKADVKAATGISPKNREEALQLLNEAQGTLEEYLGTK
jgi:hypothetical protein